MKKKIILIGFILIMIILNLIAYYNTPLKTLEKDVSSIALPENIEKVAIKSAIGDSGGNGDYSTYRVVLVVKTKLVINELKQEFEKMNLKFPNHYKNNDNKPIFYITKCEGSVFESNRDFSLSFNELANVDDYSNYYFIEFIE